MQAGKTLFGWRQYSTATLTIVALAGATRNALDEPMGESAGLIVAIWMAVPVLVQFIYLLGVEFRRSPSLNYGECLALTALYTLAYIYYGLNGRATNVYTAGHMHLLLVPLLLGLVSVPIILFMLVHIIDFSDSLIGTPVRRPARAPHKNQQR